MINVESEIFSTIAAALRKTYDGIFVTGEYVDKPASFPAVTIIESDNSIIQRMRTTNIENAVNLMYEVNVYSNVVGYKKSEAKKIMATIDEEFMKIGFARISCTPISNLQDATIFRLFARYQAAVDKNLFVYRSN